jgi:integrase
MATKYYELTEVDGFDGKLFVYKRTADANVWAYRANIDGVRGYIRRSTKQADKTLAIAEAKKSYIELVGRKQQNLVIKQQKFDEVFKIWLKEAKQRKTESRYDYTVSTYNRYLKGHFGNIDITALRQKTIDGYWNYRASFYIDGEGKDRLVVNEKRISAKSKTSNNIRIKPKYGTLRAEASIINEFLEWALRNEYVGREFRLRAKDAGYRAEERRVGRRETFTENEWNALTTYLRSYRDVIGIFKNDKLNKGHIRHRHMFYCYVLFMASTGLRVGECGGLRWQDIKFEYDKDEQKWNTQVEVRAEITKVRERRTAVAHSERCKEWLENWREISLHNKDEDLVFASEKDTSKANNFSVSFKTFLKRCAYKDREDGLLKTQDGKARTLYSLRHLYATFRITKANVEIYALAKSMGTSVKQIEMHYGHLTNEYLIRELTKNKSEGRNKHREYDIRKAAEMIQHLREGKITAEEVTEELIRISKVT